MTVVAVSGSVVSPTVLVTLEACVGDQAGLVGVTDKSPVTRSAGSPVNGSAVIVVLMDSSSTRSGIVRKKVAMN